MTLERFKRYRATVETHDMSGKTGYQHLTFMHH